jgi:23S rRNA (guanosine2251-2'-O)-methyltransferase
VLEYLRAGGSPRTVFIGREVRGARVLDEIVQCSEERGISPRIVARSELDKLVTGSHQGVVVVAGAYRYASLESLFSAAVTGLLFADGIMDPQNLGSLLRSALGAGFNGVVIPTRRASGVTSAVRRVSAGAAELLGVARVSNLPAALERAKVSGLWVVGLDQGADSVMWTSQLMDPPVALVIGAEDRGISRIVRQRCEGLVRIPQHGQLASLNAGVAAALAMFEVARRISPTDS